MTSETLSDLRRVISSSGFYAAGNLLNRGLAFILLPVYTRFLDQDEYGSLELLNSLTGILFAVLLLGLPSAVTKCYHRDASSPEERASILPTAMLLDLPVLLAGGLLLFVFAEPLGRLTIGTAGTAPLIRLVAVTTILSSLFTIVLASFRAREKAFAFVLLNLCQFGPAMMLNIVLVVVFGLGVQGVLWGNLASFAVALAIALWAARRGLSLRLNRRLIRPLLLFGAMVLPASLAAWIMGLSDRYVLRIFVSLDEIAIYAVGYKIGMILHVLFVWPFQLAWPAVSFSISHRQGHQHSYAVVLTYFSLALVSGWLALSLIARPGLELVTGQGYGNAYRIVPWVALGYVFMGIHFCVSPGIHIAEKTKYLPILFGLAAALNLGLNLLIVPRFGFMAAAWSTAVTFLVLAVATALLSQWVYPIQYEYGRLAKLSLVAALVYAAAVALEPQSRALALLWHGGWVFLGFPSLLLGAGFLTTGERATIRRELGKRIATLRR